MLPTSGAGQPIVRYSGGAPVHVQVFTTSDQGPHEPAGQVNQRSRVHVPVWANGQAKGFGPSWSLTQVHVLLVGIDPAPHAV